MVSCSFSDPRVHSSPRAERGKEEKGRNQKSMAKDFTIHDFTQRQKMVLCCGSPLTSYPLPPKGGSGSII